MANIASLTPSVMYGKQKESIKKYQQSPGGKAAVKKANDKRNITKYGISVEQFNQMLQDQGGCCAICDIPQSELKVRMAIDHDHAKPLPDGIRGLLCPKCNTALGLLKDSPAIISRALRYLTSGE
jgi:hypothetical protein